jgi:hypothetical protein
MSGAVAVAKDDAPLLVRLAIGVVSAAAAVLVPGEAGHLLSRHVTPRDLGASRRRSPAGTAASRRRVGAASPSGASRPGVATAGVL